MVVLNIIFHIILLMMEEKIKFLIKIYKNKNSSNNTSW